MYGHLLNFILISMVALGAGLPVWVTRGPTSDGSFYFVICSADALDPQEAEQLAQSRCLAGAAKLSGVIVQIHSKTVESITGNDSSEVAEIQPINRPVQCLWTNRYLEQQGTGFRVWLRCSVSKKAVANAKDQTEPSEVDRDDKVSLPSFKKGIVIAISAPPSELYAIGGDRGERIINPIGNPTNLEIKEGDLWIVAKKHGYHDNKIMLSPWQNGDVLNLNFQLERGI
jgi:hypothetical protein